jgi:hypothetical protein
MKGKLLPHHTISTSAARQQPAGELNFFQSTPLWRRTLPNFEYPNKDKEDY